MPLKLLPPPDVQNCGTRVYISRLVTLAPLRLAEMA